MAQSQDPQVRLSSNRVRQALADLGLPQWWLAAQMQVSRRTISRWLSARATRLTRDQMTHLAAALGREPAELTADPDLPVAGKTDRLSAARMLAQPGVIDTFTARHEFALLEALLRAQLDVSLPTAERGRLYCNLGLALFRQSKLAESRPCFREAARLARLAGNRALMLSAGMQHSYTHYLGGDVQTCLRLDEANLAAAIKDQDAPQIAANLSNVGDLLREAGRFDEARSRQLEALDRYRQLDRLPNLAFCQLKLAALDLELDHLAEARSWAQQAACTAAAGSFRRAEADARMAHAVALDPAHVGDGPALAESARSLYAELGIDEPAIYAAHSRVLRRSGDAVGAFVQARRGLQRERQVGNKPARAYLLFEGALALQARPSAERRRFRDWRRKCLLLYRAAGIPLRTEIVAQRLA